MSTPVFAIGPLLLLLVLGLLVVGIVLLVQGIRGRLLYSDPKCRRCGYDVRGIDATQGEQRTCPECGADLSAKGAVRFAERQRSRGRIIIGIALIVLVLVLPVLLVVSLRVVGVVGLGGGGVGPNAVRSMNTAGVIGTLTANNMIDSPWAWQELERRMQAGNLTQAEAEQAIDQLIKWLKAERAKGNTGPLHWADSFIASARASNLLSQAKYVELAKAYYGPPEVIAHPRIRAGQPLHFEVRIAGNTWDLGQSEAIGALREVRDEGGQVLRTIATRYQRQPDDAHADHLSTRHVHDPIDGLVLDAATEPGKRKLSFVIDVGAMPNGTPLVGMDGTVGQKQKWQNSTTTWTDTVTHELTVVGEDETALDLVSDASMRQAIRSSLRIAKAYVYPTSRGVEVKVDFDRQAPEPPVPFCFEIHATIDGTDHNLGWTARHENGSISAHRGARLKELPPDVRSIDLRLEIATEQAEQRPVLHRIWGEPIVFEDVPLERHDLEE